MQTYWLVRVTVNGVDGLNDYVLQYLNRLEVIVVDRGTLKVTPQTLNQVQIRCISSIPDHRHAFTMIIKKLPNGFGVMD